LAGMYGYWVSVSELEAFDSALTRSGIRSQSVTYVLAGTCYTSNVF